MSRKRGSLIQDSIHSFIISFILLLLCSTSSEPTEPGVIRSSIESGIRTVRETYNDAVQAVKEQKKPVDEFVSTGIEHSQCKCKWRPVEQLKVTNGPMKLQLFMIS